MAVMLLLPVLLLLMVMLLAPSWSVARTTKGLAVAAKVVSLTTPPIVRCLL